MGAGWARRAAGLVAGALLLAGCASTPEQDAVLMGVRESVRDLEGPPGWTRTVALEYDCETLNLDCDSLRAATRFETAGAVPVTCAAFSDWVAATFEGAEGLTGVGGREPVTAPACGAEIEEAGAYRVIAPSDVGSGEVAWLLLLYADGTDARLQATLSTPIAPDASPSG